MLYYFLLSLSRIWQRYVFTSWCEVCLIDNKKSKNLWHGFGACSIYSLFRYHS